MCGTRGGLVQCGTVCSPLQYSHLVIVQHWQDYLGLFLGAAFGDEDLQSAQGGSCVGGSTPRCARARRLRLCSWRVGTLRTWCAVLVACGRWWTALCVLNCAHCLPVPLVPRWRRRCCRMGREGATESAGPKTGTTVALALRTNELLADQMGRAFAEYARPWRMAQLATDRRQDHRVSFRPVFALRLSVSLPPAGPDRKPRSVAFRLPGPASCLPLRRPKPTTPISHTPC